MKLAMKYVILYVNDCDQSMHFYKEILGLPVKMQSDTYVEFDTGAATLSINTRESVRELIGLPIQDGPSASQTFELGFVVSNVEDTIKTLHEQGVPVIKEPLKNCGGKLLPILQNRMAITSKFAILSPK